MTLEERIRAELRGYPAERVNQFVARLRAIWQLAQTAPRPWSDAERLKALLRLKKACEEFLSAAFAVDSALQEGEPLGKRIGLTARAHAEGDRDAVVRIRAIMGGYLDPASEAADNYNELDDARDSMTRLAEVLPYLIGPLEQSERRGTKSADEDGVLAEVARVYQEILGEAPTTTTGGPFYNVAVLLLEQKNVERPVRAAVAALTK